jgi:hypothetical protein
VSVGRTKAVGKASGFLAGVVLIAGGGTGLWYFSDVILQETDPGRRMYAGACIAYGADSSSCQECRRRNYDTCDAAPKPTAMKTQSTSTASSSEAIDIDCETRPINEATVAEMEGLVKKATSGNPTLTKAIGDPKKDDEMLERFAKGKVEPREACDYFRGRIKALKGVNFDLTVGNLDKLAQCLSRLSAAARTKAEEALLHHADYKLFRSIIDKQIIADGALKELAEKARKSQGSLRYLERDVRKCPSS